ncbi:unnamed protein product [Enterobius vermicularis]|uniref:C2H2-type domain-containing protein n=1 Tax=Enterobius vermicularis TaxID=51028 RepID=A0A0N4V1X5_ENTVE|nr:unnamed protein product [Enterobius vermicularis]
MKCHYEVLEVSRDADDETIKKAYRKLALKYFSLVQQAYDVLSDPHEKAWYDRNREEILLGSMEEKYNENTLNLSPFFDASCYEGYGDDDKGFYSVYRQVFEVLANEEYEFATDTEVKYPGFGDSGSDYETVVGPFYGFWQSFSTTRPYYWISKFDIRSAINAKHLKLMKKENNKLREAAKKERNEQCRELVNFIRKRDKRVKLHRKLLEERRLEQEKKTEENRLEMIRQNMLHFGKHKEAEETRLGHLEDLEEIEKALEAEFGAEGTEEKAAKDGYDISKSYCIACKKAFKSEKSFKNHERTKKHLENLAELKKHLQAEDFLLLEESLEIQNKEENIDSIDSGPKRSKKQKRKQKKKIELDTTSESDSGSCKDVGASASVKPFDAEETVSKNDAAPADLQSGGAEIVPTVLKIDEDASRKSKKAKSKENKNEPTQKSLETGPKVGVCDRCGETFSSRTKLFQHLDESGHATIKPSIITKQGKAKKKGKR